MRHNPMPWRGEQASPPPPKPFTLVQHNCLGSWDVFLSLFGWFTQLAQPPSIVALQDPPVYRGKLPSFNLFSAFSPPTDGGCKPRVAFYVYSSFLATVFLLPRFFRKGISKKSVCCRRIGIASGRRKSVWSILSAQSAHRSSQHNGCILVRWVQYNPHPVHPVHLDGPFHSLISRKNPG